MSHVASMAPEAGKPVFADLEALFMAVEHFEELEITEKSTYSWWGRSQGDYPVPRGMRAEQLGRNAKYVISVKREFWPKYVEKHGQAHGAEGPYEIGIVEDPNNRGCYMPVYDTFVSGYGMSDIVGEPVEKNGKIEVLAPKLIQHYHMCCDVLAAREFGDEIKFEEKEDGSWVSTVETSARLGV